LHADAEERKRLFVWEIVEDAACGYRRAVPLPGPIEIVELEVIRDLVEQSVVIVLAIEKARQSQSIDETSRLRSTPKPRRTHGATCAMALFSAVFSDFRAI
jgi:hypothetical protein